MKTSSKKNSVPSPIALLIGRDAESLLHFRRHLSEELLQKNFHVVFAAPSREAKTPERIRTIGLTYVSLPLNNTGVNPFHDLCFFFSLCRLYARLKPRHVLLFAVKPMLYGSLAARFFPSLKIHAFITGTGFLFSNESAGALWLRRLVLPWLRLGFRRFTTLFFQNPENRDLFRTLGLSRDPIREVLLPGSGVPLDEFPPTPVPVSPLRFLFLSRLLKSKGILEFLKAARNVRIRHPEALFEVAGRLEPHPSAVEEDLFQSHLQAAGARYLGEVNDTPKILSRCSVLVLPSDYPEGVPRVLLEALACGRPIITTDTPGCRLTVLPLENGLLVPPRNVEALTQAMEYFFDHPESLPRMGEKSRKLAEEKFDIRKVNAEILKRLET